MNRYQSIPKKPEKSKKEILIDLKKAKGEELYLLLLSMSEIDDWRWVQNVYLEYAKNEDRWVASAAISGLGHLARISGKLEKCKVIVSLEKILQANRELEGKIRDAIGDIDMFTKDYDCTSE